MAKGRWEEAKECATIALRIAERSDFVLELTDAHLLTARIASKYRDRNLARRHAGQAQKLAVCDGLPNYAYKVAYDEAVSLLESC